MIGDDWTDRAFVSTPAPLFDTDRVTARVTWDDIVRMYQAMMEQPYRPYVAPDWCPLPVASDRSRYAAFMRGEPYDVPQSVVDACPPNAPLR